MDVSIIIINYNTKEITECCIKSILSNTKSINYEIILVDNASSDGSVDFFCDYNNINFIRSKENLGFGRANNLGFQSAKGKYIFLLYSDTILLNNALLEFYTESERIQGNIGFLGCVLQDINYNNSHSFGRFPSLMRDLYFQIIQLPLKKLLNLKFKATGCNLFETNDGFVDYITGADIFVRKSLIDEFGLFSTKYFMYYEESDLQKRYHRIGYKSKIITSPKIMHLEGGSCEENSVPNLKNAMIQLESKLTYFRSWHNPVQFKLYLLLFLIARFPFVLFSQYKLIERKRYLYIILNKF